MKNFTCTKCGSNKLQPKGDHYICRYCGATVFKPVSMPRKRILFIIAALSILLVIAVMLYNLLYSVKSDLQQIKTQQTDNTREVNTRQPHTTIKSAFDMEDNPFADVILRVESGYQAKESDNTLNNRLKSYHNYEKNKAFYISLQGDGKYAFGYAYGAKTTQEAEKEALKICEAEKAKRKLTESCTPYAVNDNISRLVLGW